MAPPVCRSCSILLPVCVILNTATALSAAQNSNPPTIFEDQPLDPDRPMTDIPDFGVAWPDFDETISVDQDQSSEPDDVFEDGLSKEEVEEIQAEQIQDQASVEIFQPPDNSVETGYRIKFSGLPDGYGRAFFDRFDSLSTLEEYKGDDANFAQIKRRAETDRELVEQLLRIDGYYDALISTQFTAVEETADPNDVNVIMNVAAGPQFKLSSVVFPGLNKARTEDETSFRNAYNLSTGDIINSNQIITGRNALETAMTEGGYAFATSEEPELVIDHAQLSGDLTQPVSPGGRYNFGTIIMAGAQLFDTDHVRHIARFNEGDLYKKSDVDDLRRAIIATGLVSTVTLDPVKADDPDKVDLAINLTSAPLRSIAGELGYGTGEGFRTEVSWEHRNFFPPEGLLRLSAVAGTQEQSGGITYRRSNFRRRDNILNGRIALSNIDRAAFAARTFSVSANIERQSNLIYQKRWSWSVGVEALASDERDVDGLARQTFFIAALPGTVLYDTSDNLLDPTQGFRIGARVSPEASLQNGSFFYGRAQIDGSGYFPASEKVTLAGRFRLGSIVGARNNRIAPSRRLYSGGGGSVRGYGYQQIGPLDANGDPVGGRSLVEFSLEARVRTDFLGGHLGIVPFIDAGNIYTDPVPQFSGLRYGAGLGARYFSDFGPIRVDVGMPINRRPGESRVSVYVSLGQAF